MGVASVHTSARGEQIVRRGQGGGVLAHDALAPVSDVIVAVAGVDVQRPLFDAQGARGLSMGHPNGL